jgi:hypothetical protein
MFIGHKYLLDMVNKSGRKNPEIERLEHLRNMFCGLTAFCILMSILSLSQAYYNFTFKEAMLSRNEALYYPNFSILVNIFAGYVLFKMAWVPVKDTHASHHSQQNIAGSTKVATSPTGSDLAGPESPTNALPKAHSRKHTRSRSSVPDLQDV